MSGPIGILGGTFDPVHNAHLFLAREACRYCRLSEVRLIPLNIPAHRPAPVASVAQRLQMLRLAIENESDLVIDERELNRAQVSYTIDTLRSLYEEIQGQPLCLIMGMDAFTSLDSWHQWTCLFDYAHIIIARRPGKHAGISNAALAKLYSNNLTTDIQDLHAQRSGKILELAIPELDISSSQIRHLIGNMQDPGSMLPENVLSFIKKEDLYYRH